MKEQFNQIQFLENIWVGCVENELDHGELDHGERGKKDTINDYYCCSEEMWGPS